MCCVDESENSKGYTVSNVGERCLVEHEDGENKVSYRKLDAGDSIGGHDKLFLFITRKMEEDKRE